MSTLPLEFDGAEARAAGAERIASGVFRLLEAIALPETRIVILGYVLLAVITSRVRAVGTKRTVEDVQVVIAESIAAALDVATGCPGHSVNVVIVSPVAGPLS